VALAGTQLLEVWCAYVSEYVCEGNMTDFNHALVLDWTASVSLKNPGIVSLTLISE